MNFEVATPAQKRVLFILKSKHGYSTGYSTSGLENSAQFVADMLGYNGVTAKVVSVIDGDGIDAEVFQYRPDTVIIEALWVTPAKLEELRQSHPEVLWVVRIHSEVSFLANEGMAIEWIREYALISRVLVAANASRAARDLRLEYLPNYYPSTARAGHKQERGESHPLRVGCFGAIRPLKNQLAQAIAAIRLADNMNDYPNLEFHVNATRTEQGGDQVLKNLRALFEGSTCNTLVENEWTDRPSFLALIASMDACMAVSFTETFCIVAADAVGQHVPLVASPEVAWCNAEAHADPNDVEAIYSKLRLALGWRKHHLVHANLQGLRHYNEASVDTWMDFLHQFH